MTPAGKQVDCFERPHRPLDPMQRLTVVGLDVAHTDVFHTRMFLLETIPRTSYAIHRTARKFHFTQHDNQPGRARPRGQPYNLGMVGSEEESNQSAEGSWRRTVGYRR